MSRRLIGNLSDEEKREIHDLYAWGMKVEAIAFDYKIDKGSPGKIARKLGAPHRRVGRPSSNVFDCVPR